MNIATERRSGAATVGIAHTFNAAYPPARWEGIVGVRQSAAMRGAQIYHLALIDQAEGRPTTAVVQAEIDRALNAALTTSQHIL